MASNTINPGPDAGPSPQFGGSQADVMSAMLSRNWWAVALRGVVAVLFGLVALIFTGPTMLSLLLLFCAYALVDGIFAIISGVRAARRGERWGVLILQGLASLIAAAMAFFWPGITLVAFVWLWAVWSIVSGALAMTAAFTLRKDHGRWWLGLGGALGVIAGVLMILAPLLGAVVLTWWLGAYAVVFGVTLLVLAFRLRSQHARVTAPGATPHPA
jgi:uncharacterized membrane protein HdeD (DUF308 family)